MSFHGQHGFGSQSMELEEDDNSSDPLEVHDELENFRQEWKSEVNKKIKESSPETPSQNKENESRSDILKAQDFYERGADCERNGDLYDAVQFYKKAFQLVPDIDRKTFDQSAPHAKVPKENPSTNDDIKDLETDFSKSVSIASVKIKNGLGSKICEAELHQDETHISALPGEVLILIFRWIVSDELDVYSLERASGVCKGFYIISRSPVLWKGICSRTWGPNNIRVPGNDWREYFLRKPRVLPHGCYISKTTYMREGEKGFQDECYRAWHIVHYYRYVRFFASGLVAMAITADPPGSVVNSLKQCYWPPPIQGMLYGRYRIVKNKVACVLVRKSEHKVVNNVRKRKSKKKDSSKDYVAPEQEMHIEFEIKGRKNRILEWSRYIIVSKYVNGTEEANELDTSNMSQYPNLVFSSVSSYFGLSNAPV